MLCFVVQTRVVLLNWCAWFLRMRRPGEERIRLAATTNPLGAGACPAWSSPSARGRCSPATCCTSASEAWRESTTHLPTIHTASSADESWPPPRKTCCCQGRPCPRSGAGRDRGAGQWWHCGRGFGIGTGSNSGGGAIHR